jgi:hypothetical protein
VPSAPAIGEVVKAAIRDIVAPFSAQFVMASDISGLARRAALGAVDHIHEERE